MLIATPEYDASSAHGLFIRGVRQSMLCIHSYSLVGFLYFIGFSSFVWEMVMMSDQR